MSEKEVLRKKFSSQPERYYKVELFDTLGYVRKKCPNCGKFFWTLEADRKRCPDPPCQFYEFLGNPPTKKRFGYVEAWKEVEDFFVKHGHTSIRRYPVVCRWRPDLYFTVASIVDFQRIEAGKVVFEFPANPLVVPQICLRFNDIPNVGLTGRHYTSFCMIGQHSILNPSGYWKDRCIELDYNLLRERFGIPGHEIAFVEDIWLGYGAFGYSLEYYARGLELGNAVFTAFEGSTASYREIEEKVVDMGAGLERFSWITQGSPTSYDCTFGPVVEKVLKGVGIEYDKEFLLQYARSLQHVIEGSKARTPEEIRRMLGKQVGVLPGELEERMAPLEAVYALCDHVRSLTFAVADGALPSNMGGGYNLRVILRRALALIEKYRWEIKLEDIARWHADYLSPMYPELKETSDSIATILGVEEKKYGATRERMLKIVGNLKASSKPIIEDDLIRLYDSEGITPELLRQSGLKFVEPPDFYEKITDRHLIQSREEERVMVDVSGLPPTEIKFYKDQYLFEFEANILRVSPPKYVVLDATAFYPRSGGQEPDFGSIGDCKVIGVEKVGGVVVHEVESCNLKEGMKVYCKVDGRRRGIIMRHHTATHVVNGASREVLGPWVWQHSAFKDEDKGRLDITHYARITREEVERIEFIANDIVRKNIPVEISSYLRSLAEQNYGFRLYQGGVVPGRDVRVVSIGDFDVEACGGTHCSRTGEIGLIKIVKSERIQDGVERLEYVAGEAALKFVQDREDLVSKVSQVLNAQPSKLLESLEHLRASHERMRKTTRSILRTYSKLISKQSVDMAHDIRGIKLYTSLEEGLDEDFHIAIGEEAISIEPSLVYCGFLMEDSRAKVIVFSGAEARKKGVKAGEFAKRLSELFGGSGGGNNRFGRGGGSRVEFIKEVSSKTREILESLI